MNDLDIALEEAGAVAYWLSSPRHLHEFMSRLARISAVRSDVVSKVGRMYFTKWQRIAETFDRFGYMGRWSHMGQQGAYEDKL